MFEDQMGFNQQLLCDDPDTRQGVLSWLERVFGAYGDHAECVDVQIIEGQLILNRKTADYIYSDFTPLTLHYQPGSRPFLEKVLASVVKPGMSERERFFAVMRRCRDNRDAVDPRVTFTGGAEEDLIKRGAIMCNEISRVFVVLCQIAGLPARVVCVHISGHMMAEACVDGKWGWCDPMKGMYAYNDDGTLASWWDLMQDPSLIDRQEPTVWDDCRPPGRDDDSPLIARHKAAVQARSREAYLHPKEATAIGNYYVWEHAKYDYPWRLDLADPQRREVAAAAEDAIRVRLGWPDHYFNPAFCDGKLRMKGD